MFEQTKALCRHFLKMGIPGFDLIVYKDGECILRHMGGYADRDNKIPVTSGELSPPNLQHAKFDVHQTKENAERKTISTSVNCERLKIPHFRNDIEEIFPQIVDNSLILWYYLRERKRG